MKTIYILLSIVALQLSGMSQTEAAPVSTLNAEGCQVIYSETEQVIFLKDPTVSGCKDLVFDMLPPVTQTLVPMRLALKKGSYTFKKDPQLEVPAGYTFLIEDTMTGGTFDFSKERPFTFNVTRSVPDRFVMFISKSKNTSVAAK